MVILSKGHAEAATKLSKLARLEWVRRGMHVFRRPGRRWTAALTTGQVARALAQVAAYEESTKGFLAKLNRQPKRK